MFYLKILPKYLQKHSKNIKKIDQKSITVLMYFLWILSSKMAPKWLQNPSKNLHKTQAKKATKKWAKQPLPKTCLSKWTGSALKLTESSQTLTKLIENSAKNLSKTYQNVPQNTPNPLRTLPKAFLGGSWGKGLNFLRNVLIFMSIWAPQGFQIPPKPSQNPPQIHPEPSPGGLLGGGCEMSTKFFHFGLHLGSPGSPFWLHFS